VQLSTLLGELEFKDYENEGIRELLVRTREILLGGEERRVEDRTSDPSTHEVTRSLPAFPLRGYAKGARGLDWKPPTDARVVGSFLLRTMVKVRLNA
jgi:hypothetical protein